MGVGDFCLLGEVGGVVGGVRRLEMWVLLMLRRSISSSMVVKGWDPFSASLLVLLGAVVGGDRILSRPSLGTSPSCQVAFAHQPTMSSPMLSNVGFWLMKSRTQ